MKKKILVTDFDGTMTTRDFFLVALSRLPAGILKYWRRHEAGELSHFEALANIYAELRVDEGEFSAMLAEMAFEPGVSEAVRLLQQGGWGVTVASAGCSFYIKKLLAEHGLSLTVHANPGLFSPECGLVMELPRKSPYFSPGIGIDKLALVRALLGQGADVAYAGDGRLDMEPLLLLPTERRFARGWLAGKLEKQGKPFIQFNHWEEIAARLLNGSASCLP
jgi:HAD superfamily phosphoserine phosphatase-like hydrolase